jgi:hypothetical protein
MFQRQTPFESPANQQFIQQALYNDFSKRDPLDQEELDRLPRMIAHYMREVKSVNGNQPVTLLNREVMRACAQQILNARGVRIPAASQENNDQLMMDTARRFEQLQSERNSFMKRDTPPAPNFLLEATEEKSNAMEMFQRQKAMRDEEMKQATITATQKSAVPFHIQSPGTPAGFQSVDIRASPHMAMNQSPFLQQDILQRKEEVLSYKENEYNLFINSIDRNWYYDTPLNFNTKKENRYDFMVNFSPANNINSFTITPAAQIKFKNISRIELVKAIIPTEAVDVFKTRYIDNGEVKTTFTGGTTILSFPYLIVRVEELESNNYGTNSHIDSTFGMIQYDNKWSSEHLDYREYGINSTTLTNPGYVCMIPKFMKCQRVYHPTPLSTLQKMTIRLERPDGTIVNADMDTFDFLKVCMISNLSENIVDPDGHTYNAIFSDTNPFKASPGNEYIVLESTQLFRATNAIAGDRLYIKGFRFPAEFDSGTPELRDKFTQFINRVEGHIIAAAQGYTKDETNRNYIITPEPNSLGYAKYIIIPGLPDIGNGSFIDFSSIADGLSTLTLTKPIACRGINGNRQVQLVFRIITREIDSSSHIRSDIV